MAKYIDKDALVAEIKRILSAFENSDASVDRLRASTLIGLLSFLDTLEVKEVDLERLVDDYFKGWYFDRELDILAKPNHYSATVGDVKDIAKHFFELGLNVSNPLTWEDINSILYIERLVLREFGGQEHSNEELCREVLKRFKAQKEEKI